MPSIINDLQIANPFFGGDSEKVVSFKEQVAWKNVFERTLSEMFVHEQQQDFSTTPSRSEQNQQNVSASQAGSTASNSTGHGTAATQQSTNTNNGGVQQLANAATQTAAAGAGQTLPVTQAPGSTQQVAQPQSLQLPPGSSASANRLAVNLQTNLLATRAHITQSANGVGIYIRDYFSNKQELLKQVQEILKSIKHTDYAVTTIKVNGVLYKENELS